MLPVKKKKNFYFIFFVSSLLFFLFPANSMQQPSLDNLNMADLLKNDPEFANSSPEKQREMLEAAEKVAEDFKKITPEQWQEIEDMAKVMEEKIQEMGGEEELKKLMQNEEEFNNFINGFASDWEKKKTTTKEEKKPEPKKFIPAPKIPLSAEELLIENLQGIINSINSFLAKAAAMPELPGKVEIWAKNNIITEWGPTITWNAMQKQIQVLLYKLNALVAIDKKTQKRRYFNYIFENDTLKNHLSLLKKNLTESEPFIDVSTFGLTKLGDQTKISIQKVIDHLGQAILKLKLNDTINSAIEKYEPLAQEIRSIEEKLLKEAELAAKKGTVPGRVIQTPAMRGGSSSMGGGSSSGSSYSGSSYPARQSNYPRTGSRSDQDYYGDSYSRNPGDYGQESGNRASGTIPKTEKPLDKAKTDEKKAEQPEKSTEFKPSEESKRINTLQQEIDSILDAADISSVRNSLLMKIKDAELTAFDYKTKKIVKDITDSLKTSAKAVRELYDNTLDHKALGKKVTAMADKLEPLFKELEKHYKLPESEKKITEARKKLSNAADELEQVKKRNAEQDNLQVSEKQKAFDTEKANVKRLIEQELKVPAEISPLLDEYNDLLKALKRFSKKPVLPQPIAPRTISAQPVAPKN